MARNFSNKKVLSLGWKPKYSLDEGLKLTINWFNNNREKFK